MRPLLTDVLDLIGLLALAAGLGFAAAELVGAAGVAVSGVVVLAGSWLASRPAKRSPSGAS